MFNKVDYIWGHKCDAYELFTKKANAVLHRLHKTFLFEALYENVGNDLGQDIVLR